MKELIAVVTMVFLAELGDKTQLATLMFAAAGKAHPVLIFAGASLALVASSALAVVLGHWSSHVLMDLPLKLISGIGFISIGLWSVYEHFSQ